MKDLPLQGGLSFFGKPNPAKPQLPFCCPM